MRPVRESNERLRIRYVTAASKAEPSSNPSEANQWASRYSSEVERPNFTEPFACKVKHSQLTLEQQEAEYSQAECVTR